MSHTSTAGWTSGSSDWRYGPFPRRGYEIAAIVMGFVFVWPVAVAYLVWKFSGYPTPKAWSSKMERYFDRPSRMWGGCAGRAKSRWDAGTTYTGNLAFEDYRQAELKRLDEERRRLDDEAREFGKFVEDLKRAKDREEFDAFMRTRREAATRDEGTKA